MPIDKPIYDFQPELFDLTGYEQEDGGALSAAEVQLRSETARKALDLRIRNAIENADPEKGEIPGWFEEYMKLIDGGYPWRIAAYIAWAASPKPRFPATQEKLATEILGLTSDRQITTWRRKYPAITEMIAMLQAAPLWDHRAKVLDTLAKMAADPDYKSHSDRKLFLEITGDYLPTSKLVAQMKRSTGGAEDVDTADLERAAGLERLKRDGDDSG